MKYVYYSIITINNRKIALAKTDKGLVKISFIREMYPFLDWIERNLPDHEIKLDNGKFEKEKQELIEYFKGQRKSFDLPMNIIAPVFYKLVYEEVRKIPYGETATYGEIAKRIGKKNASRAVGRALNRNPLPILIPCHRVVGKGGRLTGFFAGLAVKRQLLELEKSNGKNPAF